MHFDLKTQEGVLSYLTQHLTLNANLEGVRRLNGGFVNVTWRVKLNAPYQGYTSIILKHAQAHLSSDENFKIGVERSAFEYQALRLLSENSALSGDDNRVAVPQGLHHDVEHDVLIMQDLGTMKTLMDHLTAKPTISTEMASLVGAQIGAFIGGLHNLGVENKDHPEFKFFSSNTVGRTTADQLYRTIIPNAAKYGIDDPILPTVVKELVDEVMTSEETLVMADLWGGNILLELCPDSSELEKIWLIDWELCKYGPASLDMGYFLGDCFLVAGFQDESVGTAMRQSFLRSYAQSSKVPINYRKVIAGIGAHIVMWTDFMNWGSEEERKEFVKMGVEAFHEAKKDKEDGKFTSIIIKETSRN